MVLGSKTEGPMCESTHLSLELRPVSLSDPYLGRMDTTWQLEMWGGGVNRWADLREPDALNLMKFW